MEQFDLIIVGSALVGSTLALTLENTNLKIALIEQAPPSPIKPNSDGRKLVLSYGGTQILNQYGLWDQLAPNATTIKKLHISQQNKFAAVRINAEQYQLPALGYVITAENLLATLQQRLPLVKNLTLFQPAKVIELNLVDSVDETAFSTITIQHQGRTELLSAKLIVACDGINSTVRQLAQIGVHENDEQKAALITRVKIASDHEHTAYQRFTKQGILAMLPMEQQSCGFVWSASREQIEQLYQQTDSELLRSIQTYFGYRIGKLLAIENRYMFPIKEIIANEQTKSGLILLGNAAHNLSPVAAQGFNLSLQDIYVLSSLLKKPDWTAENVVSAYQAQRLDAQKNTVYFTRNLMTWFNPSNPLYPLTNIGLLAVDLLPLVKKQVFELGSGLTSAVKKLTSKLV